MYEDLRYFLKDLIRQTVDFANTDQSRGIQPPPVQKPCPPGAATVPLVPPERWTSIAQVSLVQAIAGRRSRRVFTPQALTVEELSFLLWATQGVRQAGPGRQSFRTVPSAGCRHALETYLAVFNVLGLDRALYRYQPLDHCLVKMAAPPDLEDRTVRAALGQTFAGKSAVTFLWTTVPARMEWRYAGAAHKVIALDAGHVCQNLYLACEAVGSGTCAIAAYDQQAADALLGVDGNEEFTLYLAPVGKV